jgi:hypothetical protein
MRRTLLIMTLLATPLAAQEKRTDGAIVGDIASQPVQDMNIVKRKTPDILERASEDPYAQRGMANCRAIVGAIGELSKVLGPDFDPQEEASRKLSGEKVAKGVVQSLIPFRGVIREVSGAAGAERRYQHAVDAGIARRGFLRGIARSRGCRVAG